MSNDTVADIEASFRVFAVPFAGNPFQNLIQSAAFEKLGKGRKGTVLVATDEKRGTPIVRTTARFGRPANAFRPIHFELANKTREVSGQPTEYNNALIETYTNTYTKMGFHSDLALDLERDSYIALFSCYKNSEATRNPRRLVVQSKSVPSNAGYTSGEARVKVDIPLPHQSVVLFSVAANQRYQHKIVLMNADPRDENQWLGGTFRQSKTYIRYDDEKVYLEDGTPLSCANEEQRSEFLSLRKKENYETDFEYPPIDYTISESDLLEPVS